MALNLVHGMPFASTGCSNRDVDGHGVLPLERVAVDSTTKVLNGLTMVTFFPKKLRIFDFRCVISKSLGV